MTLEEEHLLFTDLCARLPYGVKIQYMDKGTEVLFDVAKHGNSIYINLDWYLEEVKPYLRPMNDLTVEEMEEMHKIISPYGTAVYEEDGISLPLNHNGEFVPYNYMSRVIKYLYSKHIDVNLLIERDMAIDVTEHHNPYKVK